MKINAQLTWQDYMHAQHLHTHRVWWQQLIWYVAIAALAAGFLSALIPNVKANGMSVVWDYIWLPIVIVIALLLFYYIFLPRSVRQLYEQQKEMSAPVEYELTPESLIRFSQFGRAEYRWGDFRTWRENKDFVLLYFAEAEYLIIPKRLCTSEQLEALRTYLQATRVPQTGTVTRRSVIIAAVILFWLVVGAIIYAFTVVPAL